MQKRETVGRLNDIGYVFNSFIAVRPHGGKSNSCVPAPNGKRGYHSGLARLVASSYTVTDESLICPFTVLFPMVTTLSLQITHRFSCPPNKKWKQHLLLVRFSRWANQKNMKTPIVWWVVELAHWFYNSSMFYIPSLWWCQVKMNNYHHLRLLVVLNENENL